MFYWWKPRGLHENYSRIIFFALSKDYRTISAPLAMSAHICVRVLATTGLFHLYVRTFNQSDPLSSKVFKFGDFWGVRCLFIRKIDFKRGGSPLHVLESILKCFLLPNKMFFNPEKMLFNPNKMFFNLNKILFNLDKMLFKS